MTSECILCSVDLLQDFPYHCQSMVSLGNKLKEIEYKITTFGTRSASVIIQKTDRNAAYHDDSDQKFLELLEKKDEIVNVYKMHWRKAKETEIIFRALNLDQEEINLLILRFEKKQGYADLAERLHCSLQTVYEKEQRILADFTEEYLKRGYEY